MQCLISRIEESWSLRIMEEKKFLGGRKSAFILLDDRSDMAGLSIHHLHGDVNQSLDCFGRSVNKLKFPKLRCLYSQPLPLFIKSYVNSSLLLHPVQT